MYQHLQRAEMHQVVLPAGIGLRLCGANRFAVQHKLRIRRGMQGDRLLAAFAFYVEIAGMRWGRRWQLDVVVIG